MRLNPQEISKPTGLREVCKTIEILGQINGFRLNYRLPDLTGRAFFKKNSLHDYKMKPRGDEC